MAVEISLACGDYEHTAALRSGDVAVEGVELRYVHMEPGPLFYRQLKDREFEAAEMSLCNHIVLTGRAAAGKSPFVAIPAFPSRFFRHGFLYVNARAGINGPEDLRGRRIGLLEYHLTANLFIRGFLQDDYGITARDVFWRQGGVDAPGWQSRLEVRLPPEIHVDPIPADRCLSDMLVSGEIDALMHAFDPRCIAEGNPAAQRLFPDYEEREREYYCRTGIFPIMHCITLRRDVYEHHPWLALKLYEAFLQAKNEYVRALIGTATLGVQRLPLPWLSAHVRRTCELMGGDFWPYGLRRNRPTLEGAVRFAREQGLVDRPLVVEELFAVETLAT